MTIVIKLLRQNDMAILTAVAPDVFDDPIDRSAAQAFLADPRHHIAAAIEIDVVVGIASAVHYGHPDKPRPELWINEVGVAPTHHGRGLGKALIAALLDLGRTLGCSEAWVLTDRGNRAAMRLYAASGGIADANDTVMFNFALDEPGKTNSGDALDKP